MDRGARGFQVGGQIHARVQGAEELGFVAVLDELLEAGLRRPPVGLDAQLLLDLFQQRWAGPLMSSTRGSLANGRQCLLQVEACTWPIAGGHGDAGTVEQLLPLLPHERQTLLLDARRARAAGPGVLSPRPRPAGRASETLCQTMNSTMPTTASAHTARSATMAGRRLPHFQARSQAGVGRARIGSPSTNRRRSSASSAAVANRRAGSFSRHFRQIVSRSMRNARLQLARRDRLLLDDLTDGVDRIAGLERRTTHEQLVENRTQGINVGGRADLPVFSAGLFGRHVTGSAEDGAALRLARVVVDPLGQTKIRDLGNGGPRPMIRGQRATNRFPGSGSWTTGCRPSPGEYSPV